MSNLNDVLTDMDALLTEVTKRLSVNLLSGLYRETNVDTGHARSNWIAMTGAPFTGVVGSRKGVSDSGHEESFRRVEAYRLSQGPIRITNNVHYILVIDDRWNPGFVRRTIEAAIDKTVMGLAPGVQRG